MWGSFEDIQSLPQQCTCSLAGSVIVPYRGAKNAEILIVGESPGQEEIKEKRPFSPNGRSGKLIRSLLETHKIPSNILYFANSARCLLDTTLPKPEIKKILAACIPNLELFTKHLQPKCILLLGDIALQQVLGRTKISNHRGRVYWSAEFNCWVIPAFHPAYVLRSPSNMVLLEQDIAMLAEFRAGGYQGHRKDFTAEMVETIRPMLDIAETSKILCALDIETQGLGFLDADSLVISYSVSYTTNTGYQVFLHRRTKDTGLFSVIVQDQTIWVKKAPNFDTKLAELKELLEHPNITVCMQNGNFDLHHIHELFLRNDMDPPKPTSYTIDIQAAANLIDENKFKQSSLDFLAKELCGYAPPWKEEFNQRYRKEAMLLIPEEDLAAYAVEDAVVTRRIALRITRLLDQDPALKNYFDRVTMPVLKTGLWTLEHNGVYVDQTLLSGVEKQIQEKIDFYAAKVTSLIPPKIAEKYKENPLLTKVVMIRDVLFSPDGFALASTNLTAKGLSCVDKHTRSLLNTDNPVALEFVEAYDRWLKWSGLLNRSLAQLKEFVNPIDGRVHTHYSICQAVTGRISSSGPNLMNVVARTDGAAIINQLIRPSKEGWKILEADFAQAELKWIAHVANEQTMIDIYKQDLDIHTETAQFLNRARWDSMSSKERKEVRRLAKSTNFGFIYGMSANRFSKDCQAQGIPISIKQAIDIITNWFNKYSGIKQYHRDIETSLLKQGFVSSPFGRRRHLPAIKSEIQGERAGAIRQAINFPIQSVSSDTALLALVEIINDPEFSSEEATPILFIHDSLAFEVREDCIDKYATMICWHMENPPIEKLFGIKFKMPFKADLSVGDNRASLSSLV